MRFALGFAVVLVVGFFLLSPLEVVAIASLGLISASLLMGTIMLMLRKGHDRDAYDQTAIAREKLPVRWLKMTLAGLVLVGIVLKPTEDEVLVCLAATSVAAVVVWPALIPVAITILSVLWMLWKNIDCFPTPHQRV
jgi:phosphatidylglycerophosphate synthase